MDIIKSATFITKEDRWVEKLAIGVGVLLVSSVLTVILVGILGFFIVAGYTVRLLQNVRDGKEQVLPEWNEWSGDLGRGFKLFVVMLVWTLAVWIFMIPLMVGSAMSGSDSGFVQFVGAMLTMTAACFMMLYGIFIVLAQPGVSIAFAADEQIRSGLALSKVWNWTRANLGQVIIAAIAVVVASFLISAAGMFVGTLLCIIGLVLTIPLATLYTYIYQFHLYGQLAQEHPFDGSKPVATESSNEDGGSDQATRLMETDATEVTGSAPAVVVGESVIEDADAQEIDAVPVEDEAVAATDESDESDAPTTPNDADESTEPDADQSGA